LTTIIGTGTRGTKFHLTVHTVATID